MVSEAVPSAVAEPSERIPCCSTIVPEIVFAPDNVSTPEPALLNPPVPAKIALITVFVVPTVVMVGDVPANVSVCAPAMVIPVVES